MTKIMTAGSIAPAVFTGLLFCASPQKQQMTPEKIEAVFEKISSVDQKSKKSALPGKVLQFSEEELSAYLLWKNRGAPSKVSVSDAGISLPGENRFILKAGIKFELTDLFEKEEMSPLILFLKTHLNLSNRIEVEAQVISAKGKGRLLVKSIKLNGVKLPEPLVDTILKKVGGKQKPPVDPNWLMDIPYGIKKIEILPKILKIYL